MLCYRFLGQQNMTEVNNAIKQDAQKYFIFFYFQHNLIISESIFINHVGLKSSRWQFYVFAEKCAVIMLDIQSNIIFCNKFRVIAYFRYCILLVIMRPIIKHFMFALYLYFSLATKNCRQCQARLILDTIYGKTYYVQHTFRLAPPLLRKGIQSFEY